MMKSENEAKRKAVSPMTEAALIKPVTTTVYTVHPQQARLEIHMDPEKRPSFANITDDYNLLENLLRYSKVCESFNVPIPQMAQSLARAIGIQNQGKYSVILYDYLLAIPEYPPTVNGKREALYGEGRFCNMVCYKSKLFGVVMFPTTDNVTFYFSEFSSYSPHVQQLIFTYGNKVMRYCDKRGLAFDFQAPPDPAQAILLTATLQQRKMNQGEGSPHPEDASNGDIKVQRKDHPEYIQLE